MPYCGDVEKRIALIGPTISAEERRARMISSDLNSFLLWLLPYHFDYHWGGPPDWNNWSSSTRLELSVGHAVRVCEFLPSYVRAVDPPILTSSRHLTVASDIAHEHRPKSVQGRETHGYSLYPHTDIGYKQVQVYVS